MEGLKVRPKPQGMYEEKFAELPSPPSAGETKPDQIIRWAEDQIRNQTGTLKPYGVHYRVVRPGQTLPGCITGDVCRRLGCRVPSAPQRWHFPLAVTPLPGMDAPPGGDVVAG